jgi:hypothetical protein
VFERLTEQAREVVVGAVDLATRLRSPRIDTGHVLAVLAGGADPTGRALREVGVTTERVRADLAPGRSRRGLDPTALSAIGIDYDEVRRAVDSQFGPGALERSLVGHGEPRAGRLRGRLRAADGAGRRTRFDADAKKALGYAVREAAGLRDRHIGTEHLLLGLLGEPSSVAGRLLAGYGVDTGAVRRAVLAGREPRAS